jgi:hypothetical protein
MGIFISVEILSVHFNPCVLRSVITSLRQQHVCVCKGQDAFNITRHDVKLQVVHYHNNEQGKHGLHNWPQNVYCRQMNSTYYIQQIISVLIPRNCTLTAVYLFGDRLCGLVVRVPGYRSRGSGSISGATRHTNK